MAKLNELTSDTRKQYWANRNAAIDNMPADTNADNLIPVDNQNKIASGIEKLKDLLSKAAISK